MNQFHFPNKLFNDCNHANYKMTHSVHDFFQSNIGGVGLITSQGLKDREVKKENALNKTVSKF